MNSIIERDRVRAALTRALELDPVHDLERAIASASQSLGLPDHLVRAAAEDPDEIEA